MYDDLPAYLVCQVFNWVLCVTMGTAYVLQWLSESYSPRRVVSVKRLFHRVGLCCILLLAVRSIDPYHFQGYLPSALLEYLTGNVTNSIFLCACAAVYYVINAISGIAMDLDKPTGVKAVLAGATCALFLLANGVTTWMLLVDKEWVRGVLYIVYGAFFGAISVVCLLAINQLRAAIRDMLENHTPPNSKSAEVMEESRTKLLWFQVLGGACAAVAVANLVYTGATKVRDTHPSIILPSRTSFDKSELVIFLQWFCLGLFFWWAWIPFYICGSSERSGGHSNDNTSGVTGGGHMSHMSADRRNYRARSAHAHARSGLATRANGQVTYGAVATLPQSNSRESLAYGAHAALAGRAAHSVQYGTGATATAAHALVAAGGTDTAATTATTVSGGGAARSRGPSHISAGGGGAGDLPDLPDSDVDEMPVGVVVYDGMDGPDLDSYTSDDAEQ